jgi:tetratricopeptide (TPR) repeat protein
MGKFLRFATLALGIASAVVACAPAPDQQVHGPSVKQCTGDDRVAASLQIDGCSAIIAEGKGPRSEFVLAYIRRGVAYARQNAFRRAIDDYNDALGLDPDNVQALANRGFARIVLGPWVTGIHDCERALVLKPNDPEALAGLALFRLKFRADAAAVMQYNELLAVRPNDPFALFGRGLAKRHLGDTPGADVDIASALQSAPAMDKQYVAYGVKF